jgi:hypothetical protein
MIFLKNIGLKTAKNFKTGAFTALTKKKIQVH